MVAQIPYAPKPPIALSSLSSFSDNIYAFSMTILITTLRLPPLSEQQATTGLLSAVERDWRFIAIYIISFLTISSYWLLHHTIYTHVIKTDRVFIWLNLLLLLTVTFLPYPTALMGKYGRSPDTALIYGFAISLTYLQINLIAWYACKNHRLIQLDVPDKAIRIFKIRVLVPLVLAITGTALALANMHLAFLSFFLVSATNTFPWPKLIKPEQPTA